MSPIDWTPEKVLQVQFTKKIRRKTVNNAELYPSCLPISEVLLENEIGIVRITADDDTEYYLTERRLISLSDAPLLVFQYQDVIACDLWFPDGLGTASEWMNDDVAPQDKIRVKAIYFSRILVILKDETQLLFTGLGDSTNIIHWFLVWLTKKNAVKKETD